MFQNISLSTFHNSSLFFFSSVLNFILLFSDCILTLIITLIYLHVPIVVHVGASQRLMKMSKKTGPHNSSFGTIHAQIHCCLSFFTEVFYLLSVFRFILSSTVFTVFLKLQFRYSPYLFNHPSFSIVTHPMHSEWLGGFTRVPDAFLKVGYVISKGFLQTLYCVLAFGKSAVSVVN